jgi:hypothetical protein
MSTPGIQEQSLAREPLDSTSDGMIWQDVRAPRVAGPRSVDMTQEPAQDESVAALTAAAFARYGARLDEGQKEILREHVERLRGAAAQLDVHPLQNADEPDFAFRAIEQVDRI